ncbi:MAG: hypothetical protein RLY14_2391 [Planctomycetota bacterium]|jgi:predicted RNA-binding protein with PIN domain
MRLLIDGYNLLHFSGLLGKSRGQQWLLKARKRLLQFLQEHLPESLQTQTLVVFDASTQGGGADNDHSAFGQIRVRYSVGFENADELIEQLITAHPQPKMLLVVSSDHRIQRCARAHRCEYSDCESWLSVLEDRRIVAPDSKPEQRTAENQPKNARTGLSEYEVQFWMREFGIQSIQKEGSPDSPVAEESVARNAISKEGLDKPSKSTSKHSRRAKPSSRVGRSSEPKPKTDSAMGKEKKPKDQVLHRRRAKRKLPDGFQFPETLEEN